ncbi:MULTISPECIES: hypothetical protein [Paraburkholderia]|uniref:hypothetical protein n=1 Tax=Paraburkholderia TaxID=1822464 RepID=UPI002258ABFB|nr:MULTISPECIES: hypothetical protein [Paraburkholderia]MCX4165704.1 hypothetical protein [Paraburkholderia megapolitana]MDN7161195.1 hypothetical protein [Paraburkholderia sp. CHISQ3]MDQ6498242.1 hypothetical protein [Paraburkholderia megapolitana]
MSPKIVVIAACLALAACGGDGVSDSSGGGSSHTGSGTSGTGGTGTGPTSGGGSVRTMTYEALAAPSDATSVLAQLNAEGAKGYRYIADLGFSDNGGTTAMNVFINDGANTYSYEFQNADATQAGFLAQANQEGAKGFRYEGPLTLGNLYRHQGNSSATYSYAAAASPTSSAAFLTQANAQGQSGYWYYGPVQLDSASTSLYMKDNSSASKYTYDAVAPAQSVGDFVTQANNEGAKGYRFKGPLGFGTDSVAVYVKDQTQSPTFTYLSQTPQPTSAAFIQQANAQGAQSEAYLGGLAFGSTPAALYFLATGCTGFLCSSLNTFIQN